MTTDRDILATVESARERARRARRAGWIPLAVFGVVVLPALLFHLQSRIVDTTTVDGVSRPVTTPYANVDGGQGLLWYWQLAIPLGYALVASLFALRNRRAGIRTSVRAYLITGVVLVVAVYYLANAAAPLGLSNVGLHGMEATVTIGLALFVLSWLERNPVLAGCAAVVTTAAVLASQYDVQNLLGGTELPGWLAAAAANDLTLSAVLLVCAAVVAVVDRSRRRSAAAS